MPTSNAAPPGRRRVLPVRQNAVVAFEVGGQ